MKQLLSKPHIIISVENPKYPTGKATTHEGAVESLKRLGDGKNNIHETQGVYGGAPERSIFISEPTEHQQGLARHLSHSTGQESHVESDGYNHKLLFNHGDQAGEEVQGRGTAIFNQAPQGQGHTIFKDGTKFAHNFKFKKSESLSKSESGVVKINPEHGAKIAQAYDSMKHDPHHPEVKAAYGALINETKAQYQDMLNQGFKFTPMKQGQENPYKNSKDVHADLEQNKHLHYFPTKLGYGQENEALKDHPLLQPTGFKDADGHDMPANDLFRVVHDYRGHHLGGKSGFGQKGEHMAYLTHKKDFSPLAQKALASETMGQNQWIHHGPHKEHNTANPKNTIYAEQKAGILPTEIIQGNWHS